MLLFSVSIGCAPAIRIPGPLGAVGKTWRAPAQDPAVETENRAEAPPPRSGAVGDAVAESARDYLGATTLSDGGETWRMDCSGLVEAAYAGAGITLSGTSPSLYEKARQTGVYHRSPHPHAGDVAFFEDTYDRDRDGRIDDGITHVAIVESVSEDGAITLVHFGTSAGISRIRMQLTHPDVFLNEEGLVANSHLRRPRDRDPKGTHYLTGELWAGFASFWEASSVAVTTFAPPPK